MNKVTDLIITAIAPIIWGSSYIIITELLPDGYPLTTAGLRALPAGILLLFFVRKVPRGIWIFRIFILGGLNFAIFWGFMFISAYKLPGGVAGTLNAIQPAIIILFSRIILGSRIQIISILSAILGLSGVALLLLTPDAALDLTGILAGMGGATSMALGTVLTRYWKPPVGLITFTAWQLTAGGILLLPVAMMIEPPLPHLSFNNIVGLTYLAVIGAVITYIIWFRGISRIEPNMMASLGFLSPLSAVILGRVVLGETMNESQLSGILLIPVSIWLGQRIKMEDER